MGIFYSTLAHDKNQVVVAQEGYMANYSTAYSAIQSCAEHNLEHIDYLQITVRNKKTNPYSETYSLTVYFTKNGMSVYKSFDGDTLDNVTVEFNSFISSEIKI